MNANWMKILVPLVVILIVVATVYLVIKAIGRSLRRAKNQLFGSVTTSLIKSVMDQTDDVASDTPRSLSNLERAYLPIIKRQYPDLRPDDLRNRAGVVLKEYLDSVQAHQPTPGLSALAARSLCDSVRVVSGDKYQNHPYVFHQAVINNFEADRIRFDLAFKTDKQRRGSVTFCYMKDDVDHASREPEQNCVNCGAVLYADAQKKGKCPYCETVFRTVNDFDWLAVKIAVDV